MVELTPLFIIGLVIQWGAILVLVCFSGLFSGLNLGLMSLTEQDLVIVVCSGSITQAKHAKRIYPIRRRGNLLLCTILLGNVSVNALLSILLSDFTSGVIGFLASTILIVIFGEIVPQAVCSRHALAVGYYTVWFVWCFEIVLLPIAYPISKILDKVLGAELGTIYSKAELKKLFDLHASSIHTDLTQEETTILAGALDFGSKHVEDVMTPLDKVFMLNIDERLDGPTIAKMLSSGYSRVPVYKGDKENVVGLLFVKDLALLNPEENIPLGRILEVYGRNFPRVFSDTPLNEMLKEFKAGQSHIAVVRHVNDKGDGDPFYENTGIITLEDVIEEILQEEIVDETDVYQDNTSKTVVGGRRHVDYEQMRAALAGSGDTGELVDLGVKCLSSCPEFGSSEISESVLRNLVVQCLSGYSMGSQFYSNGKHANCMTAVVKGRIVSDDGTAYGPGEVLGMQALRQEGWVADFSAEAEGDVSAVCVTKRAYRSALQATGIERANPSTSGRVVEVEEDDPY
eukprot:TRINITY_DN9064_c0_g2_i2.p1 TRINITY_DN9064_c0_g2~~TRINITY_DN9064_c0_g2_i2.p1  ORF type:complete len:514 (+),score=231.20 TRINITY_DN9064_c0_g2_i2:349-1890(+)